jgi:hypothetical protein
MNPDTLFERTDAQSLTELAQEALIDLCLRTLRPGPYGVSRIHFAKDGTRS